jgi:RNA polymerase sigma factor (sigma-70 family)
LTRSRRALGVQLLRLRSDDQLVALFRSGDEEAFRVIHDRYRQRLFAYARQMLGGSRYDAEDAIQDIFVRAYSGLRANDRELALRAWLYRIAHNRCVDELRRPAPPPPEVIELVRSPILDPTVAAEQRESIRRLLADVQRLPQQQRSALLMREFGGMSYADLSEALDVSVPAVKSLLVRARVGLVQALDARNTACSEIREAVVIAHDRGQRPNATARRHMRDCGQCRQFRTEVRGTSKQFAALVPVGLLAKALGFTGFGSGAGGGAAAAGSAGGGAAACAGGGAATGTAVTTCGAVASVSAIGAGHVATLLAAAVVTAGGAVAVEHSAARPLRHRIHHYAPASPGTTSPEQSDSSAAVPSASAPASASVSAGAAAAAAPAARTAIKAGAGNTSSATSTGSNHAPVSKTAPSGTTSGTTNTDGQTGSSGDDPGTSTGSAPGSSSTGSATPTDGSSASGTTGTTDPGTSTSDPTSGSTSQPDPGTAAPPVNSDPSATAPTGTPSTGDGSGTATPPPSTSD